MDELRPPAPDEVVRALLPFAALVALAFLLDRLRGEEVDRSPADELRTAVARFGEEIAERAWTVGRDTRAEQRKERAWRAVEGATGALFTLAARRAAAGVAEAMSGQGERGD